MKCCIPAALTLILACGSGWSVAPDSVADGSRPPSTDGAGEASSGTGEPTVETEAGPNGEPREGGIDGAGATAESSIAEAGTPVQDDGSISLEGGIRDSRACGCLLPDSSDMSLPFCNRICNGRFTDWTDPLGEVCWRLDCGAGNVCKYYDSGSAFCTLP